MRGVSGLVGLVNKLLDKKRYGEELGLINRLLPNEILETIFLHLPHRDLKVALLVCKRWRQVGEVKRLWSSISLRVDKKNLALMPEMLCTRRLQFASFLEMKAVSKDLLNAVLEHPGLTSVRIQCMDEQRRFGRRKVSEDDAWMKSTAVLNNQERELLFKVLEKMPRLSKLDLTGMNISSVHPSLLARALTHIEEVVVEQVGLTHQQALAFFEAIGSWENVLLRKLNLSHNNIACLPSQILSRAVHKLEEVTMYHTNVTSEQVVGIFTKLSQTGPTNLCKLWIGFVSMPDQSLNLTTLLPLARKHIKDLHIFV